MSLSSTVMFSENRMSTPFSMLSSMSFPVMVTLSELSTTTPWPSLGGSELCSSQLELIRILEESVTRTPISLALRLL